jgi:hypothetical protein
MNFPARTAAPVFFTVDRDRLVDLKLWASAPLCFNVMDGQGAAPEPLSWAVPQRQRRPPPEPCSWSRGNNENDQEDSRHRSRCGNAANDMAHRNLSAVDREFLQGQPPPIATTSR